MEKMTQEAPFPHDLMDMVNEATCKPGWRFELVNVDRDDKTCHGLTLIIYVLGPNSDNVDMKIHVSHWFPVPAATYDLREWEVWLFERCMDVERHETMEFFKIGGKRPFAPHHRRGRNPYRLHVIGTEEDIHRVQGQDTK
jgi:hypothetical protein